MPTSTGFFNPFTGFQTATEAPWVRQQRMGQERDLAMAAIAAELDAARMRESSSKAQSSAYRDVGMAQAEATKRAVAEKETVAQRDARRERQMQGEARRWAKAMQEDIDQATALFKSKPIVETKSLFGIDMLWKDENRPPNNEEVAQFRKEYAAKLEKSNAPAIRGYKGMVKIDAEAGTFEFIGDEEMANAWEVEDAAEKGDAVPAAPKYDKDTGKPKPEDPAAPKRKYVHIGEIGADGTTYHYVEPGQPAVKITRSAYFKGIGEPDPQNAVSRKGESGPAPGGAAADIMGQPSGVVPLDGGGGISDSEVPALAGKSIAPSTLGIPVSGVMAGPMSIPPLITSGVNGVANIMSSIGPAAQVAVPTGSALVKGAGAALGDWASKTWEEIASTTLNRPTSDDVSTMRQIMADPAAAKRLVDAYPQMSDMQKRRVLLTVEAAKAP